ncbi:hypothetical protein ONZ45_g19236 [Pleurotus djamor]|nr:hypothetical protein ONZ45_g19236 [Pleurotus djamor]
MAAAQMPSRGHHSAPKFSGEGQYINRFIDEVDALATAANLTDRDKIAWTLRYAGNAEFDSWSNGLAASKGNDWEAFKTALRNFYPEADDDRRYTEASLEAFVLLHSRKILRTKENLGRYHREFVTMASFLESKELISKREIKKLYIAGFDFTFQEQIRDHLHRRNPTNQREHIYTVEQVYEIATFILEAPVPATVSSTSSSPTAGLAKQEPLDPAALQAMINASMQTAITTATQSMSAMLQQFTTSVLQPALAANRAVPPSPASSYVAPAAYPLAPAPVSAPAPAPGLAASVPPYRFGPPTRCSFCHETSHTARYQCPSFNAMNQQGWVYMNDRRKLALPNHQEITRALRGDSFKDQVENWRRDNGLSLDLPGQAQSQSPASGRDIPPHMARAQSASGAAVASTNMMTVANFHYSPPAVPETIVDDSPYDIPFDDQLTIAQNVISTLMKQKKPESGKKEVRFDDTPRRSTRLATETTPRASTSASTAPPLSSTSSSAPPLPTQTTQLREALETGKIKPLPQYRYHSNAEDPKLTSSVIERALDAPVTVTQRELLSLAPDLRRHVRELTATKRIAPDSGKVLYQNCSEECSSAFSTFSHDHDHDHDPNPDHVLSLLVQEQPEVVTANDTESLRVIPLNFDNNKSVDCILDSGSQIISMRRAVWEDLALPLNLDEGIVMEAANHTTNKTKGLARNVRARIGNIQFYLQIQVVESAPYDILLGRPFHCLLSAVTTDYPNGRQDITITDPNSDRRLTIPTSERRKKPYKKVANRVKPVATTLPSSFRIVRRSPPDILADLKPLPTHPPDFTPGIRYTQERYDAQNIDPAGWLWPEEIKLAHFIIRDKEMAFAWDESEKGMFSSEWFDPVVIPTIEHVPWALRNIPIPPGIYDKVVSIIKEKIATGVYEDSSSSYRSRWFCVPKKDGKSLRLVHDLQPLNAVTIKDAAVPPRMETFAEDFGGRACYAILDALVAYDQRPMDEVSRDMTTFQTPFGAKRLTRLPMGYTNALQIMQGDVAFIFQDEIPHVTNPFVDDCPAKGPTTRYELPDGTYETIPENPGIRRFVFEHLTNVYRLIHRMGKFGGTFSGRKVELCIPRALIVGHMCTYAGREPDESKVQKIKDWPVCKDVTDVRSFLGTLGVMRHFIKDFALHARPLVDLTKKDAAFIFGDEQIQAMNTLKQLAITSPALRAIDHSSDDWSRW